MGNTVNRLFGINSHTEQDPENKVDFVLAYDGFDEKFENQEKRKIFEKNLQAEGLQLDSDKENEIHFVKIYAPNEVILTYADILMLKMPMKSIPGQETVYEDSLDFLEKVNKFSSNICSANSLHSIQSFHHGDDDNRKIFHTFSRSHRDLFDLENPIFFDYCARSCIIKYILERQHFKDGEETYDNLGIEKLLHDGVYLKAYPLHDDDQRKILLHNWACIKKSLNKQPLDMIKQYLGAKVALYFAWLGFYTNMLIPLSILGILCFIYGLITLKGDPISTDICKSNSSTLMCPQCDSNCDYWELKSTCNSSRMNYLLDNALTIFFAFILTVWSVLYLELWKRYSSRLLHNWGLTGFSQEIEHPRPQYLLRLSKLKDLTKKFNAANSLLEPLVPFWEKKFWPSFTSYSIVVLFVCVSLTAIFALIVYRMAQTASRSILGTHDSMLHNILVFPLTAGILDLLVITILHVIYKRLAVFLSNLEYCRTQTEYEESVTIKNYIFQFVNYYSTLFYIAFFKSKYIGYPAKYNRIFGFRQQECNPGGCLMELCIQLIIIMIGKQALLSIFQISFPYIKSLFRVCCTRRKLRKSKINTHNPWTQDFYLEPFTSWSMFTEYLEMVIQFGFVILFGLAFPLTPLMALINNLFELRLDAIKFLKFTNRPVALRVHDIGCWLPIMTILTKISVITSAVIIAFSTNFIAKIVYRIETKDSSLEGFLDFTLSFFNTEDFEVQPKINAKHHQNVTKCLYADFRNPPDHENPYGRPIHYWKILIGRLAFIVVYQNVVGFLQAFIKWAIPDVPSKLMRRIKREEYLIREHIIDFEKKSALQRV